MATLNRDEQARVDRAEQLKREYRTGSRSVTDHDLAEAEQLAAYAVANAEARERQEQRLQAEEAAKTAARQAERDTAALAAQEAYLRQARASYPGTEAQWQQDKDDLLRQWRLRNAVGADMDALVARKREQYGGSF